MERLKTSNRRMSRSEGFGHIENYYRSGLRPHEYYKQQGISEHQFYSWRKRYLSLHPQVEPQSIGNKKFHRVKIEPSAGLRISGFEIHYPHGVRVVIGNDQPIEITTILELIKLRV